MEEQEMGKILKIENEKIKNLLRIQLASILSETCQNRKKLSLSEIGIWIFSEKWVH